MSSNESSTGSTCQSPQSSAPTTPPQWNPELETAESPKRSPVEDFARWRPSYHVQVPIGWMNDPCAPGFDPDTGLYHVSFQWNPNGPDWGNIAWGTARSSDLISWTVNDKPILSPDTRYDGKGVFTGCFIKGRDGSLNYPYTSVSALPIHHTLPHPAGIESLSIAKSLDGGSTWQKITDNPILPSEPKSLDVTGWRDPYVAPWPSMCKFLRLDPQNTLFGIISGGVRKITPTTFLYSINANDLTKWTYVGPLTNFGLNLRPSRWSGDLGVNWEVTNFLTLNDQTNSSIRRDFLVMGTEGCLSDLPTSSNPPTGPTRPIRGQLWMSGSLQMGNNRTSLSSPVDMTYNFGGHLDHGCFYAANSFFDPQSQKHIVWGWIGEDDLCDELRHRQGWSGMLSMPREISMQTIANVTGCSVSKLSSITCIEVSSNANGSSTIRTLASQPFKPLVEKLRSGPQVKRHVLGQSNARDASFAAEQISSKTWELDCSFKLSRNCQKTGFSIGHSADFSNSTTFTFDPRSEVFTVERPSFTREDSDELINTTTEKAPHTLFTTTDPFTGGEETEALHIQVWRDNSVMEVFVNGRTAISTRIYAAEETYGVTFFAVHEASDKEYDDTELLNAVLYDNIGVA